MMLLWTLRDRTRSDRYLVRAETKTTTNPQNSSTLSKEMTFFYIVHPAYCSSGGRGGGERLCSG